MRKIGLLILLALLLTGCGKTAGEVPQAAVETTSPTVDIGGTQLLRETDTLDLSTTIYNMDALLAAAAELPNVQTLELGTTELTAEEVLRIQQAFPRADIRYDLSLFGKNIPLDTTFLDMSAMSVGRPSHSVCTLAMKVMSGYFSLSSL